MSHNQPIPGRMVWSLTIAILVSVVGCDGIEGPARLRGSNGGRAFAVGATAQLKVGPYEGRQHEHLPFRIESVESDRPEVADVAGLLPDRLQDDHRLLVGAKSAGKATLAIHIVASSGEQHTKDVTLRVREVDQAQFALGCREPTDTPLIITHGEPIVFQLDAHDQNGVALYGDLSALISATDHAGNSLPIIASRQRQSPRVQMTINPAEADTVALEAESFNVSKTLTVRSPDYIDTLEVEETWRSERNPGEFRRVRLEVGLQTHGQIACPQDMASNEIAGESLTPDRCVFEVSDTSNQPSMTARLGEFGVRSIDASVHGTCRVRFSYPAWNADSGVQETFEFEL